MSGALAGVKVLDAATVLAGPVAATILSDFGAEVVKLEDPGAGDFTRAGGRSPSWLQEGRNKKSVTLNLRAAAGQRLLHDAKALESAGAFSVVLEGIPAPLAGKITESLRIPTIGIGAGPDCDAQVLVWQDMAGLSPRSPKFAKRYADLAGALRDAAAEFAADVAGGTFPSEEYSYK